MRAPNNFYSARLLNQGSLQRPRAKQISSPGCGSGISRRAFPHPALASCSSASPYCVRRTVGLASPLSHRAKILSQVGRIGERKQEGIEKRSGRALKRTQRFINNAEAPGPPCNMFCGWTPPTGALPSTSRGWGFCVWKMGCTPFIHLSALLLLPSFASQITPPPTPGLVWFWSPISSASPLSLPRKRSRLEWKVSKNSITYVSLRVQHNPPSNAQFPRPRSHPFSENAFKVWKLLGARFWRLST